MQTVPKMSGPTKRLKVQCLKYPTDHGQRDLFLGFANDGTVYPVVFAVVNKQPHYFDPEKRAHCDYIETIPLLQRQGYATELWSFINSIYPRGVSGEAATWNGGRFLKSVGGIPAEIDISRLERKTCPCCGRFGREASDGSNNEE